MEDPGPACRERRAVARALEALSPGLDADELHLLVAGEGDERTDRIATAAHTGDHAGGQRSSALDHLSARLVADHALEITHKCRVGRRTDRRSNHVMGRLDVRDPVADCRADGLLERPRARLDRRDPRTEELHPLDVWTLASHVLGPHVDDAVAGEQRAPGRYRHAVLAGSG